MATEYIHELGDSLSTGASSDGPHVKVIAPEKYKVPGSDTYKTISVEIDTLGEQLETLAADIAYKDAYDGKWIGLGNPVNSSMDTDELKYWRLCSFTISSWWSLQFEMDVTNGLYDWNTYETKIVKIGGYSSGTSVDFAQEIREYHGAVNTDRGYGNILYYTLSGTTVTVYVRSKRVANASQFCRLNKVVDQWKITSLTWYRETSAPAQPSSPTKLTEVIGKQPERLVVSSDDNTAFSKISAAITAGKDVWLNTDATYSGATYSHYVPLTEAVFRSGAYTAFIFSRSRAYSDENGIVDRWTCNSSSWTYETEFVAYAATAGTAGTAGTANSASNANLGKTSDATKGDLLYIGGGTQQRVTNAAHATSAKDYDQTGSIATALAGKQPTVVFYGTSRRGTLSYPAISKSYLDTFKDTYVRCYARHFADTYDGLTGTVLSTIEMGGQRILDELFIIATNRDGGKAQVNDKGVSRKIVAIGNMYTGGDNNAQKTEYTLKPNRPYNGSPYNGHSIPVYEDGWRKNVIFELTINNTDVSPEKIYLESGGAYHVGASSYAHYTQSQIIIDGVIYGTSGNPTEWSDNYRYKVAIGSVPAGGSRTWQIVWWSIKPGDTVTLPTGSYTYYEKEFVVVTTIK